MVGNPDRIDGWKAIGSHFGRDRTTVIRWARDRGLPVHRIPGGDTGSVFALRSELDAWSRQPPQQDGPDPLVPQVATDEPPSAAPDQSRPRWRWPAIGAVVVGLGVAAFAIDQRSKEPALPENAEVARLYLDARDAWATREPAGIASAIAKLHGVTAKEPDFAPAHVALADAYILAREFGSMPDDLAFSRARKAAEQAIALDPDLAAAHRARGFVSYWWEHDSAAAGRAFRKALEINPNDAQTHFWYGNILADNGEAWAARRELTKARLLDPGSPAIQVDMAWALWLAGDTVEAERQLRTIIAANPEVASAHDALSIMVLERGDFAGYLAALKTWNDLRGEATLARRIAELDAAAQTGGPAAIGARLIELAREEEEARAFPDHSWAAFVASSAGDKSQLREILAESVANRERWGSAGFHRAIAARWPEDKQVQDALKRLQSPRIEPTRPRG